MNLHDFQNWVVTTNAQYWSILRVLGWYSTTTQTQVERFTSPLLIKHLTEEDPEGALGGLEGALPGHARHAVRLEVGRGRPPAGLSLGCKVFLIYFVNLASLLEFVPTLALLFLCWLHHSPLRPRSRRCRHLRPQSPFIMDNCIGNFKFNVITNNHHNVIANIVTFDNRPPGKVRCVPSHAPGIFGSFDINSYFLHICLGGFHV